jgi:oligoendopeptidase F
MNQSSVELNSIKYALGRSFAICFQEKMRENYREGWKEYKEFITLLSSLPLNDVIEKYFDTELINNHVKTLIKSYH